MKEIRKIMCACGSGLGSSLLVEMNIQDVLANLGISGVEVSHSTTSDVQPGVADLFVVGRDLADFLREIDDDQKVILTNIVDKGELEEKLREKLEV